MPRAQRQKSESGFYHIMVRGEGRRILFEDDEDRVVFLRLLSNALDQYGATAFAWCLMSNHAHVLAKVDPGNLPRMMQSLTSGYAVYYNKKHDHVGHVFGGRFNSKPIETDEYFLQVVRYIHMNPVEEGLTYTCMYKWSSYCDFLDGTGFVDIAFVLEAFGGLDQFVSFHEGMEVERLSRPNMPRSRMSDDEARGVAKRLLGELSPTMLGGCAKSERDAAIARLRSAGLSVRQIERLTGIGRGIISRVKWK